MKKVLTFVVLSACLLIHLSAQSISLNQGGYAGATFTFKTPDLVSTTQTVGQDTYSVLTFEGSTHLFRDGEPDLPVVSQVIEMPLCSGVKVSVSNVQTRSLNLSSGLMLPMQPAPGKSDLGPRPFVIDSALYATDAFYAADQVAWVDRIGVARDRNLGVLRVSPISYNPVTGVVEIVTSLTITLTYQDADEAATRELHRRYYSPAFSAGSNVLATLPADKSVRQDAPIHLLIVAHSSFRGALDEYIAWKRRCGMLVTIGYTDEAAVGTTSTAIANYVRSFYTNATEALPAPTYLLIAGDHEQIPAFSARCTSPASDHITDLYYVTWDNDNIPDCYRGRFSAKNPEQLLPQISKSLLYEQFNFDDSSYLAKGILIAGEDGGRSGDNAYVYADPTMDYVAKTYITASNGFSDVKYYKNNTSFAPAGVTVTGSSQTTSTASTLRGLYNQGCGWVNYSAHGSSTSWATPELTTSHAAQMNNVGKPGVFIGNCCLTGKFEVDNCFGESLLRRGNNAGAVAYIGATNSTYWPHDFCWSVGLRNNISGTMNTSYDANNLGMYDRLFHTHNEDYTAWYNTFGAMVSAGNMAVESYGSYQLYYWEIYQLFGDPSITPWLGIPDDMTVEASDVVFAGTTEYTVTAAPRAYVALTSGTNHDLITAAYADQTTGQVTLTLPADLTPGSYELVVRAQGYKTHFQELMVVVPSGPYLTASSLTPVTGKVVPGQANVFDLVVVNQGVETAWSGTLDATSVDEGVVSLLPTANLPTIEAGDTLLIPSAVSVFVPASYTYGNRINVTTQMAFADRTSQRTFTFNITAPRLEVTNVQTDAALPGSVVNVSCTVTNTGNDSTADLTFSLQNIYCMVATQATDIHVGVMAPDQSVDLSYTATMAEVLPATYIPFNLYASSPNATSIVTTFSLRGQGEAQETFETGDFTAYEWNRGTSNRWEITTADKHAGTYSARSYSSLSSRRTSTLRINWSSNLDDSITFWYKVSSEEDYDIFSFSMDGTTLLEASGTNNPWTRAAFAVPRGSHTFTFSYAKDWSTTGGSDCAWIDDITFPYQGEEYELLSDTICQNEEYTFAGHLLPTSELGTMVYIDSATVTNPVSTWLALTVAAAPEVTITTSGDQTTVPQGGQLVLTAHGATTYLWSTGDTTASIVVSPTESTTYSVTGYRGGCSGEASINISVGIDAPHTSLDKQLKVYPNPTDGIINVVCPAARRISVVNMLGQVVYEPSTLNPQLSILNLNSLPEGVYYLKVETLDGIAVQKILKR